MTSRTRDHTAADGSVSTDGEDARVPEWSVGIATRDITPEETAPHRLAGFAARDGPMDGVTDDIHVKAVAFEDATGKRLVVLSAEILFILPAQRARLANLCADRWNVEPEALLINPTHTHYAPAYGADPDDLDCADETEHAAAAYRERLDDTFLSTIDAAIDDLAPAELHYSHSRCAIAMSRRRPTQDGISFKPHAEGPVDHGVPVLTIRSGGTLRAILFGYACHPTSVNTYNRVFGDWPGEAMRRLEEEHSDTTALFLIGCAGDQKAYPQGSVELARQHGQTMANAVEAALETEQRRVHGPLRIAADDAVLDIESPIEDDDGTRTATDVMYREYPMQAVGFGTDLTLLSLSGEVVADYARRLKEDLGGPVWVTAYANSTGYIPTRRVLSEGGYEARQSHAEGRYAASTEDRILGGVRALAERVGCRRR